MEKTIPQELEILSTEQLMEILHIHAQTDSLISDTLALQVLEVLERRETEHPTRAPFDVDRAWEDFQKFYNTEEGKALSLYPVDAASEQKRKAGPKCRKTVRRLLIAAAIISCLLLAIVPSAFGHKSIFTVIGRWSDDLFYFEQVSDTPTDGTVREFRTANAGLKKLHDTTLRFDIDAPVIPTWVPEDIPLQRIDTTDTDIKLSILALFASNDRSVSINVSQSSSNSTGYYEKDVGQVTTYDRNGTVFYLFENAGCYTASWRNGDLECFISGTLSKDELLQIIDSISPDAEA